MTLDQGHRAERGPSDPAVTSVRGVDAGPGPAPRSLGLAGWSRWAWRTLTSMRTALILLALLALAAVPGSLIPQRNVATDPAAVARFVREHPALAPWLERLDLFEVYSAPWFAAIYLLLLVSMTGCVLPRCWRLWRSTRAEPPRAPSNLARLPVHKQWTVARSAEEILAAAEAELRRRRFRVRRDGDEVRAEKGFLREAGNLGFHLSLLVLLVGVALGRLYGFEATVVVVEGSTFSNDRSQYDSFSPGPLLREGDLAPFAVTLTDFEARFESDGPERGAPRDFRADVEVHDAAGATRTASVEVNHPLEVDGTKVFLTGNGYAPHFTIEDGVGRTVFAGPIVFLPRDANLSSEGVIKIPDAQPTQLAFEGFFLPTAIIGDRGPVSAFPDILNPGVFLTAYTGDLGLDEGLPQSVYSLDKSGLAQVMVDGQPLAQALQLGETMTLPGGQGSVTFDGISRFANFQVARDPGKEVALAAAVLLLTGLTTSLLVRQRRVWIRVRAGATPGEAVVEAAALAMTKRGVPDDELGDIAGAVRLRTSDETTDNARAAGDGK